MKKEWFEAWFDSPFYHQLYQARDEAEARRSLDKLILALDLQPGARVLDMACGKGRHSRYLAEKGFDVTGLDLSKESIDFARHYENDRLEFFQHDMRKPFRINYYDAVLNMFTSFGYFKSDQEHLLALQNMCRNLKSGGRFLLDFFNSRWVREHLVTRDERTIDGIAFHIRKRIEGNRVYKSISIDAGFHQAYTESVRLFDLDDFRRLFEASGLRFDTAFGSYELEPFDPEQSKRLILTATKAA